MAVTKCEFLEELRRTYSSLSIVEDDDMGFVLNLQPSGLTMKGFQNAAHIRFVFQSGSNARYILYTSGRFKRLSTGNIEHTSWIHSNLTPLVNDQIKNRWQR